MRVSVLAGCALLVVARSAFSTTIHVSPDGSGDYPTIQAAVDAAHGSDEIILLDGTFTGPGNRDVVILGKTITIRSQSANPAACVVDCEAAGRGFYFQSISHGPCALEGVTVANGHVVEDIGGAVFIAHASPTIRNCVFLGNESWEGGAIFGQRASPLIEGCVFVGNRATIAPGGALYFIINCSPTIKNCTIVQNQDVAGLGGGIGCSWSCAITVERSIISGSVAGSAVHCDETSVVAVSCSDVFGNADGDWVDCIADQAGTSGNLSADPRFCDAAAGDFTLRADSPCAPPSSGDCGLIGALSVACGSTAVEPRSWGSVKALYR